MLGSTGEVTAAAAPPPGVSAAELISIVHRLATHHPGPADLNGDAQPRSTQRIDQIAALERLKGACAAAQARLSADLLADRLAHHRAAGTRPGTDPDTIRRGVAAEIALARRQSPARARKMLGLAQTLTTDMPHTLAALASGTTSEYRAQLIAQEFGCLAPTDRAAADQQIGPKLAGLGDLRSRSTAAAIAARLDAEAVLAKIRLAVTQRRVTLRPAPDALSRLLIGATAGRPDAADAAAVTVFLRRLFTDPDTGQLVAMDSRAREFPAGACRFLIARDQICRTPWCDAPIRHIDHINPVARGGPTTIGNGQGLCANCNYTKESPGWASHIDSGGTVTLTSPTGHRADSAAPVLPRSRPWTCAPVPVLHAAVLVRKARVPRPVVADRR